MHIRRVWLMTVLMALAVTLSACGGGKPAPAPEYPPSLRQYMESGREWFRRGELAFSLVDFNEAVKMYPDHYAPYHGRAWVWMEKGELGRALLDFNRALALNPDFALAYRGRSHAYERMGRIPEAIRDMEAYISLEPDDPTGPARLAELEAYYR